MEPVNRLLIFSISIESFWKCSQVLCHAHFNNTEGLTVLVMELLGDSLVSFVRNYSTSGDKIHPKQVTNLVVQVVSFEIDSLWIECLLI